MARKQLIRPFNYIVIPKVAKWIKKAMTYRFNILEGQIRSGKDITGAVVFLENIKKSDEHVFMIGAVNIDKAMRIVGQYIIDYCGGMAIKTKYNESNAIQFIYKDKVNYIVFASGYNKNAEEFIQGDTYGGVYLTEINLLNNDFIAQSMKRMASCKDPFLIGTLNPKGPRHWFYREFLDIWEQEQINTPGKHWLNYEHLTMFDNPIMTEEMIIDAARGLDPNSTKYKRDILGLRVDPESSLFTVRDYNILNTIDFSNYNKYMVVIDIGESRSATAFTLAAPYYNKEKNQWELHILKEYHHINDSVRDIEKKSQLQYIDDYVAFIKECISIFDRHPNKILFDGTDAFWRDLVKKLRENGLGQITPKRVTKETDEERIYRGQSWLYQEKFKIYKGCTKTIEDFKTAEYDSKKYESSGKLTRKDDYTATGHGDTLDNCEYLMTQYKKLIN